MLKSDGTYETDANGEAVATYDNDDIMAFARVWTGYYRSSSRANQESENSFTMTPGSAGNYLDPTYMDVYNRDYFPKMDLYDRYLGDRYPLCTDLPERSFLRRGAKYRLIGKATATAPIGDSYPYFANSGGFKYDVPREPRGRARLDKGAPNYVQVGAMMGAAMGAAMGAVMGTASSPSHHSLSFTSRPQPALFSFQR